MSPLLSWAFILALFAPILYANRPSRWDHPMKMLGLRVKDWSHTCYQCRHTRRMRQAATGGQRATEKREWKKDQQ